MPTPAAIETTIHRRRRSSGSKRRTAIGTHTGTISHAMSTQASTAGLRIGSPPDTSSWCHTTPSSNWCTPNSTGKPANISSLRSRTIGKVATPRPPTTRPPATLADSLKHIDALLPSPAGTDALTPHAIQVLQEIVRGQLDCLVTPLGGAVMTRDQAHAMDASEVAVDER